MAKYTYGFDLSKSVAEATTEAVTKIQAGGGLPLNPQIGIDYDLQVVRSEELAAESRFAIVIRTKE